MKINFLFWCITLCFVRCLNNYWSSSIDSCSRFDKRGHHTLFEIHNISQFQASSHPSLYVIIYLSLGGRECPANNPNFLYIHNQDNSLCLFALLRVSVYSPSRMYTMLSKTLILVGVGNYILHVTSLAAATH